MKFHQAIAVTVLASVLPAAPVQAAELKLFVSTAMKGLVEELAPQFEKATENKVTLTVAPAAVLKGRIDQGADFDVSILTAPLNDALAAAGKLDAAPRVTIARAGLGVSVRAGASKPDVSTAAALKHALLDAKSIGYNGVGASRSGIEAMLAKLGIADAVKAKTTLLESTAPEAVAKGEVEIGLGPISEILAAAGAQVAGPFPGDLQTYLVFTAGMANGEKNADAAKALIKFLVGPAAPPLLKAKGMEPG
jgi:molybdate transport system substrate-binding protein